jgi:hypothetical protein
MRHPAWEFSDRPFVRDIYVAQSLGFPIHDTVEFEVYRAALTSTEPLTGAEVERVLRSLAGQARAWLDRHRPALWAQGNSGPGWPYTAAPMPGEAPGSTGDV